MIEAPMLPRRSAHRDRVIPAVIAASVLLHVALVAALLWAPRPTTIRPTEISVEVVQLPPPKPPEEKKPASKGAEPNDADKAAAQPPVSPRHASAKASQAKAAAAKQARQEQAKQEQARQEQTRQEQAAQKQARREQARQEQAKQAEAKQEQAKQEPSVAERMQRLIGPMPAMALPAVASSAMAGDDTVSYRQIVLSQVARQKKEGRYQGIPGVATVAFTLGDHGEVLSCEVRKKSGDPSLDEEAMAMVRRGSPYPTPPPGSQRSYVIGLRFQAL